MTETAAESIWQKDLFPETKDFLVKLYGSEPAEEGDLVPLMEKLPMTQRQLASLYILTNAVERSIRRLMVKERQRILAEFEIRQRSKIKPSGPRLHVHIGRDEDCKFCKNS